MKLDAWLVSLELISPEGDLEDDARALLVEAAENTMRAGVTITLREWMELGPESQSAFITAGDRIRAVTAYLYGCAARSKAEGLAILAKADGGDALIRELLEKTTQIASDRIESKRPIEMGETR